MRYLFLLLLVVGALMVWRRWSGRSGSAEGGGRPEASPPGTMVQCKVCGIYLPEEESLSVEQFHYCSATHRDQDTKQ